MTYPTLFDVTGQFERIIFISGDLTGGDNTVNFDVRYVEPRNIYLEYVILTDNQNSNQAATAGTIELMTSMDGTNGFHYFDDNANFNAADANNVARLRPRGVAIVHTLRVALTSIVVPTSPYRVQVLLVSSLA